MKKHLALCLSAWLAGFCLFSPLAAAQPVAGRDFTVIEPAQATDDPGRIEVIEFFSYACPHCNDLNPLIQQWAKKLPRDVYFKRVPVNFNPFYELMAKLFYALDATDDMERLDTALFTAIHEKGLRLINEKSITEWAVSQGVDGRRFSEAWNSFSIAAKMKRAEQIASTHHIRSVPAVTVDGRYLVIGKNLVELPDAVDRIIKMRRAERNASTAKK
jgi:thiol:disulfide interchange protein DsbA